LPKPAKLRLDVLLVERGLADSRQKAQAMILAGGVRVAGQPAGKPGALVAAGAAIEVAPKQRYASRGGFKLEGALDDFEIVVSGKLCADLGSSTGGFTDCLLQRGARHVYAVDVSPEQLDWRLRTDPRVTAIKRNARNLAAAPLPEPAELVTVDLSFISAAKVLAAIAGVAGPGADLLILVKPQFELERREIGKGGIVREAHLHQRAIERVTAAARACGLRVLGVQPSRLPGAEGNQEFFLHARRG
jgi:23S rRNA (cytidine1920-2'-O)/16S rRNA (cytidine1409-2'-O)-methyltransferase